MRRPDLLGRARAASARPSSGGFGVSRASRGRAWAPAPAAGPPRAVSLLARFSAQVDFDLLEIRLVPRRPQFGGRVDVLVAQHGLDVAPPGVLRREDQPGQSRPGPPRRPLSASRRQPLPAQAAEFAVTGDLDGVAGAAVDPGVADLLRHQGHRARYGASAAATAFRLEATSARAGELPFQLGIDGLDLVRRVDAAVVATDVDRNGEVAPGRPACRRSRAVVQRP